MKIFPLIMFEMSSINISKGRNGFLIFPFLLSFQSSAQNIKNINVGSVAIVNKAIIIPKNFIELHKSRLLKPGLIDNTCVNGKYLRSLADNIILIKNDAEIVFKVVGNRKNFKKTG